MRKDVQKAYLALVLVSFFWGTTYVAIRIGAQEMPGLFVSCLRQLFSGAILVAFFLAKGHAIPSWNILKRISIQSIFLLCIANGLISWSMEYIDGGLASIISALVPLFIALFSTWLSRYARLTRWMIVGLVIGFAGILIIFSDYLSQWRNASFAFGVGLAVLATMSWSFGTVYSSRQQLSINILFNVGLQMLIAGLVLLVVCIVSGRYVNLLQVGQHSLMALFYLVVFGSLLTYSAYVFMITKLPPTQASVYAYINPIVAVLLGWLLLSEKMNTSILIGTAVTLTGVYLVNQESKKSIV